MTWLIKIEVEKFEVAQKLVKAIEVLDSGPNRYSKSGPNAIVDIELAWGGRTKDEELNDDL